MNQRISTIGLLSTLAAIIVIWKAAAFLAVSPFFPAPEEVFTAFINAASGRIFWMHFLASVKRLCMGIAASWLLAFPAGLLMGYSRAANRALSPLVLMSSPIPTVVLLPVIMLISGPGDVSVIILVSLFLFFQVLASTRDCIVNTELKLNGPSISAGGEMPATGNAVISRAITSSLYSMRVLTGTAVSILFFAESFSASTGLGCIIMESWAKADYMSVLVGITGMCLLGTIFYLFFILIEKLISPPDPAKETTGGGKGLIKMTVVYSRMIKLSHTVFALPFALSGLILAMDVRPVTFKMVFWIIIAMVGARSAAMGFNRVADASIDAANPRTAMREIPAGTISRNEAVAFIVFSSALLVFAAAMLSWICFWLSFPLLIMLFFYSYTKRFTWLAHIYLGFAIGLAPVGVWIAIVGMPGLSIIVLALTLMTHIAGFDILYACQDKDFDREKKLYSIPSVFGITRAFRISSALHIMSVLLLGLLYFIEGFGYYYFIFIAVIAVLYIIEHRIVKPGDISNINIAFFHINSIISVLVFVTILTGKLTGV